MGFDLVELVMAVEDEFGISIPDADASSIETVGQLHQYLCWKIAGRDESKGRCASMAAFHRVRTALVDAGIAGARDIGLDTVLTDWAPASPQAWYFFLRALGLPPIRPPLPAQIHRRLRIVGAACAVASVSLVVIMFARHEFSVVWSIPAIASFMGCIMLARHVDGRRLPPSCGSVRGFVRRYEFLLAPPSTDARVWQRLVGIVAEQFKIDRDKINGQTHFIRDLGAG
jgi:acyl carrier protein